MLTPHFDQFTNAPYIYIHSYMGDQTLFLVTQSHWIEQTKALLKTLSSQLTQSIITFITLRTALSDCNKGLLACLAWALVFVRVVVAWKFREMIRAPRRSSLSSGFDLSALSLPFEKWMDNLKFLVLKHWIEITQLENWRRKIFKKLSALAKRAHLGASMKRLLGIPIARPYMGCLALMVSSRNRTLGGPRWRSWNPWRSFSAQLSQFYSGVMTHEDCVSRELPFAGPDLLGKASLDLDINARFSRFHLA